MKRTSIRSAIGILLLSALLAGCGEDEAQRVLADAAPRQNAGTEEKSAQQPADGKEADPAAYAEGTVIRMSCACDDAQKGMRFDEEAVVDGVSYQSGDMRPEWLSVQNALGIVIEDHYDGKTDNDNFIRWQEKLEDIDMLSVSAVQMTEAGEAGELVNLTDYLDRMPHFAAFMEEHPIARMSLSLSTDEDHADAVYAAPYLSGTGEIENMPFMRADWVRTLLDGKGEFSAEQSGRTALPVYQPFMPVEGKISLEVAKADGSGTETISRNYDKAGNIIAKMNAAGAMSGVDAVNMLRTYIDEAYNGYYGTKRSDLFLGLNAAWDADELVALLRCVTANAARLNPEGNVSGLFTPEESSNASRAELYRLAGCLFGVRGLEGTADYLYMDRQGQLHDARCEQAVYDVMLKMNEMSREGLISPFYQSGGQSVMNAADPALYKGFMSFTDDAAVLAGEEEAEDSYTPVLFPVSLWDDGSVHYMRFAGSVRSVQAGGWAVSAKAVEGDTDKLNACLALIDHMYSASGKEEKEESLMDSALRLGVVQTSGQDTGGNLWYTSVPAAFALTNTEEAELRGLNAADSSFSEGKANESENVLINVILRADTGTLGGTAAAAEYFRAQGLGRRLEILQTAWDGMRK